MSKFKVTKKEQKIINLMEEVIKTKLSNIKTEYRNAHIEVLEDIKPPVTND